MSEDASGKSAGWWIAGFFMLIGILWMALSGLCTVGVIVMGEFGREVFPMALLVGGLSALIGGTIYVIALALRPTVPPPEKPPEA